MLREDFFFNEILIEINIFFPSTCKVLEMESWGHKLIEETQAVLMWRL